jgi:hypothetical protein
MLRRIFGSKKEVIGRWRKSGNGSFIIFVPLTLIQISQSRNKR